MSKLNSIVRSVLAGPSIIFNIVLAAVAINNLNNSSIPATYGTHDELRDLKPKLIHLL